MVTFQGYFDESGDFEQEPKVFCISGYFLTSHAATVMDAEWGRVLDKHGIPYFHMVDCAHGSGHFSRKSKEERTEIVMQLIDLIKAHTLEGFSTIVRGEDFQPSAQRPDVYSSCVASCVMALQVYMKIGRTQGEVAYFFEAGHKNKGRAYSHVAGRLKSSGASLEFGTKQQVRLLQAADLLAWHSAKYAKDTLLSRKREPRKDFLSLMEHDHSFFHEFQGERGRSVGIELWPLKKRSARSTSLSFNDEGPITFLLEKGDDTPILTVSEPVGYRLGGGRMAYLVFKSLGDEKFTLAFDQPRLHEAIHCLITATRLYADDAVIPAIPATDIDIGVKGDDAVLQVRTASGAIVAFHLPKEAITAALAAFSKP